MKHIPYASAVGSLMYARTRPGIAYAVGLLGRYQSHPGDHRIFGLRLRWVPIPMAIPLRLLAYQSYTPFSYCLFVESCYYGGRPYFLGMMSFQRGRGAVGFTQLNCLAQPPRYLRLASFTTYLTLLSLNTFSMECPVLEELGSPFLAALLGLGYGGVDSLDDEFFAGIFVYYVSTHKGA